jgi:hypothetical protein
MVEQILPGMRTFSEEGFERRHDLVKKAGFNVDQIFSPFTASVDPNLGWEYTDDFTWLADRGLNRFIGLQPDEQLNIFDGEANVIYPHLNVQPGMYGYMPPTFNVEPAVSSVGNENAVDLLNPKSNDGGGN